MDDFVRGLFVGSAVTSVVWFLLGRLRTFRPPSGPNPRTIKRLNDTMKLFSGRGDA